MSDNPIDSEISVTQRAWFLLALLALAYMLSLIDRMVLGILTEPIRKSLGLSDTALSLLQGLAFLMFYSVAGLPLGMLADRVSRVKLIGVGLIVWSLATGSCGLATGFGALFAARMLVGVGEASLSPAAYSLVTSSFPPARIGLALGAYSLGGAVGGGLALLVGGVLYTNLAQTLGNEAWRHVFLWLTVPGLMMGAVFLCLKEPQRTARHDVQSKASVFRFYRSNWPLLLLHHVHFACALGASFAATSWIAPFFSRVHGWSIKEVGFTIGIVTMIAGAIGYVGAGALSDFFGRNRVSGRLAVSTAASLIVAASALTFPFLSSAAGVIFGLFQTAAIAASGVATVALQSMLPPSARGGGAAILILSGNLVAAIGTTSIALLSDHVFVSPDGIRYSIAWIAGGSAIISFVCGAVLVFGDVSPLLRDRSRRPA